MNVVVNSSMHRRTSSVWSLDEKEEAVLDLDSMMLPMRWMVCTRHSVVAPIVSLAEKAFGHVSVEQLKFSFSALIQLLSRLGVLPTAVSTCAVCMLRSNHFASFLSCLEPGNPSTRKSGITVKSRLRSVCCYKPALMKRVKVDRFQNRYRGTATAHEPSSHRTLRTRYRRVQRKLLQAQ